MASHHSKTKIELVCKLTGCGLVKPRQVQRVNRDRFMGRWTGQKEPNGKWLHTHTRLTALFLGLPRWAGTRKVKPIWILLKQETVSGSGISWAICKTAPCSRQITTPSPHHSVFYRPDALPAAQPTASKHWRHIVKMGRKYITEYITHAYSMHYSS